MKRIPGGEFSAYAAHELKVGDELEVMTPLGRFGTTLDPANAKHYAFVAAGSGITPVLSLVATILATEPTSRVTLLYGNRTAGSVMFADELADLKDRYAERLHLVHVLSRESTEVELFSGRIDAERLGRMFDDDPAGRTVSTSGSCAGRTRWSSARRSCCSSEASRASTCTPSCSTSATRPRRRRSRRRAGRRGRRRGHGDPGRPPVDASRWPSTRRPSSTRRSRSGRDAPFACKGGVCGTCRAKVLEGTVRMDTNWALEPDEIRAGYVLTCQSHPTSPKVTLDYDA